MVVEADPVVANSKSPGQLLVAQDPRHKFHTSFNQVQVLSEDSVDCSKWNSSVQDNASDGALPVTRDAVLNLPNVLPAAPSFRFAASLQVGNCGPTSTEFFDPMVNP